MMSGYSYVQRPLRRPTNDEITQYNIAASNALRQHFNPNLLDPKKTYQVNMYYADSPHLQEAY